VSRVEVAEERAASPRPVLILLGTAAVIYVADQVTKALVAASITPGERIDILGDVVQLWHAQNTGAAFSLFPGQLWLFLVVAAVALVMVAYFHRTLRDRSPWLQVVLGMILAGTLGNLTDRLRKGYVVDFISVGLGDLRWPTFNVADSSVVMGILILVAYLTISEQRRGEAT
jgi:signal peptidase II